MSTYLVAFHVSDFAHAFSSAGSVPHRIFTRPDVVNQTARALRNGERMLDALSEHFGMDYVLPKMDAASLPEFGGAMENFGLITYRHYNSLCVNVMLVENVPFTAIITCSETMLQMTGKSEEFRWKFLPMSRLINGSAI